ncbi:hypothetical protein PV11_04993 [Exophiala sideris]|uniref:Polynucleotide 5'-hydroxyl-kinase GRC3 n=1 Tax=Exophiala sideris TaxID=1016849 RepID=A0A0D1Z827_9EURO|nr:hypothetical protein PV11_04993 [Exophiala sideris]
MPANGERLSAVARQRRLREARSSTASTPVQSPVPAVKGTEHAGPIGVASTSSEHNNEAETQPVTTSNQFTTLVDAAAVHFSSSREVEKLGEAALKIRLARGQRCVLAGVSALWVKQGSVSVYGAILHASTAVYCIYAPLTHALPPIEALTSTAELQLDSVRHGIRYLPYIGIRDIWNPVREIQTGLSFHVLGHSFQPDPKATRRVREIHLDDWKPILAALSEPRELIFTKAVFPRILICGRGSSGISTMTRCLINRLLRNRTTQSDAMRLNGVILLDFNTNLPEIAPPGMISLVHVTDPMFGPSFTHVTSSLGPPHAVIKMHFLGDFDETDLADWHVDRVHDLIALEQTHRRGLGNVPVIILAPKWMNAIDQQTIGKIWKDMAPTDIVCMDSRPNSPHLQTWRHFAEADACRIHQLGAQVYDNIPPAREHDLQMQSYFHVADSLITGQGCPETPILARSPTTLAYAGDESDICAIVLLGGHVALEDTYDALEGSVVAVLIVQRQQDKPITVDDTEEDQSNRNTGWLLCHTEEYLPRLMGRSSHASFPFSADHSRCIGLAMVTEIDIMTRQVALISSLALRELNLRSTGSQLALVMQKASPDGRFRTDWARKEMRSAGRERQGPTTSASEA